MKKFLAMCCSAVLFCCSFASMFAMQENSADMLQDDCLILGEDKVYGISVSFWQGDIDWQKVKDSGVKFAIIRDGYGRKEPDLDQVDSKFERNVKLATEAGIDIGVYHYCYADSPEDAINEANFCLENMGKIDGLELTYPVVVSVVDEFLKGMDSRTLTDVCVNFCETVKKAGYTPAIYCRSEQIAEGRLIMEELAEYDLWVSDWDMEAPSYECDIWQCTIEGSVSGIEGDVCIEVAFKDYK